jgi:hypothetical protein
MTAVQFDHGTLASLPPPVARYFAFALARGQPRLKRARLGFSGTFAVKPNVWSPFTAREVMTADPIGFEWEARIRVLRFLSVRVCDTYVTGEGRTRATVMGLPLVDQRGSPQIAVAALQRFLAEAVWMPTALLPSPQVSWEAIDDTSARVTCIDGLTTASLDVAFGSEDEIVTVSAMRYRAVGGALTLTPWIGEHRDYRRLNGMMIPTSGEVAWILDSGVTPYWRGQLIDSEFEV